jgi:hypothetical protein
MKKREYVHDIDVQRRVGELLTQTTAVITTITILDDRGGSGMWIVTHETEPTDGEIETFCAKENTEIENNPNANSFLIISLKNYLIFKNWRSLNYSKLIIKSLIFAI